MSEPGPRSSSRRAKPARAQKAHAEIRVFVLGANVAREPITGEELIELIDGVIGERIVHWVLGIHNRADFEDGVAVERARVTLGQAAVDDDSTAFGVDHSYYHADALTVSVDTVDEDLANFGVGRGGLPRE